MDIQFSQVRFPNNGHFSAIYFSAASRTTHASETFFSLAMTSSVSYISGGKLIDARIAAAPSAFIRFASPLVTVAVSYLNLFTTLHHFGEPEDAHLSLSTMLGYDSTKVFAFYSLWYAKETSGAVLASTDS